MKKGSVVRRYEQFVQWIWASHPSKSWYEQFAHSIVRLSFVIAKEFADGQLSLRATSLVYTTLISVVPLLALSFSVLKGFGVHNQLEPSLLNLLEPLGDQRFDIIKNVIGFVDNVKVGVLGTVGLAVLLYSVIAMMHKIESAFNYTWRVRRGRSFVQRFSHYLTAVLMGPLLIFVSIGLTSAAKQQVNLDYLTRLPVIAFLLNILSFIIPSFLMALAFTFIYVFIPNTKVSFRSAFVGGVVSTVAWKTMGYFFSHFVSGQNQQTLIYSAFASVILFIFWLYLGWLTLMVGASVAFHHQNPHYQHSRGRTFSLSIADEEHLLLQLSYLIADRFNKGFSAETAQEYAKLMEQPQELVDNLLNKLSAIGFSVFTTDRQPKVQPVKPLKLIQVEEIVKRWRLLKDTGELTIFNQELTFEPVILYIKKHQLPTTVKHYTYQDWLNDN